MAITIPERGVQEEQAPDVRLKQPPAEAFGQPMLEASEKMLALVREENRKANEDAVDDADNQAADFVTNIMWHERDGSMYRQGQAAVEGYDADMEAYEQHVRNVESSLANDAQKKAFRARAERRRLSMDDAMKRYIGRQVETARQKRFDTTIENFQFEASHSYDNPEAVSDAIRLQEMKVRDHAKNLGLTGDDFKSYVSKKTRQVKSDTHTSVINYMMAEGQDVAAENYYKANSGEIIDENAVLKARVEEASSAQAGREIADEIWVDHGPKSNLDPVEIEKMVGKITDPNPKVAKLAKTLLREKVEIHNKAKNERRDANMAVLYEEISVNKTPLSRILQMQEFKDLDGKSKATIVDYNRTKDRIIAEPTGEQWGKYWTMISEPEMLVEMSTQQIDALEGDIGRKLVNKLQSQKQMLGRMDFSKVSLPNQMFRDIMALTGMDLTKVDKGEMAEIHGKVMDLLGEEQERKKGKLSRDEIMKIMREEIDNKIITDAGILAREKERIAFLVPEEEIEDVVVPPEQRLRIAKVLEEQGIPESDDLISRLHIADIRGDADLKEELLATAKTGF